MKMHQTHKIKKVQVKALIGIEQTIGLTGGCDHVNAISADLVCSYGHFHMRINKGKYFLRLLLRIDNTDYAYL